MRSGKEMQEAFKKVGDLLNNPDYEDDETLQAIYETLKWADGYPWEHTVEQHLPL